MKSVTPSMPWVENLPFRVFESRLNKSITSSLPVNEKRIFRFRCGEERASETKDIPESPTTATPSNINSMRLFCSRFIKIRQL